MLGRVALWEIVGSPEIVRLGLNRTGLRRLFIWGRALYVIALLVAFVVALGPLGIDRAAALGYGASMFLVLATVQLAVALLLPPILLSQAIGKERRCGSIGLLLMTHRNPAHVVRGLVTSRILILLPILLGGLPVSCVVMFVGGVSAGAILGLAACSVALAIFGGAVGAFVGSHLSPHTSTFNAVVATMLWSYFVYSPLVGFGMAWTGGGTHVPPLLVLGSLAGMLIFHRYLTRRAAQALTSREVALSRTVEAEPSGGHPFAKAAPAGTLVVLGRHRSLRPAVQRLLGAAAGCVLALSWPQSSHAMQAFRYLVLLLLGTLGATEAITLLATCSIAPAARLASFMGDAVVTLLALTPIDPLSVFDRAERRQARHAVVALATMSLCAAPSAIDRGITMPRAVMALASLAALVVFLASLSFRVGVGSRSTTGAMAWMITVWVVLLASLAAMVPWDAALYHPLALPFSFALGAAERPVDGSAALVLLALSYLLRSSGRRLVLRAWREPFEAINVDAFAFG